MLNPQKAILRESRGSLTTSVPNLKVIAGEPDYSYLPDQDYDCTRKVYGAAKEHIPKDIPTQKDRELSQPPMWMPTYIMISQLGNL